VGPVVTSRTAGSGAAGTAADARAYGKGAACRDRPAAGAHRKRAGLPRAALRRVQQLMHALMGNPEHVADRLLGHAGAAKLV
jgi:hypothetical protein